jgi:hypothetical protein
MQHKILCNKKINQFKIHSKKWMSLNKHKYNQMNNKKNNVLTLNKLLYKNNKFKKKSSFKVIQQ